MCGCEIQIQLKGGTFGSRYAPTGVVAIPVSAVKSCMSFDHACPINPLTIAIIISARANEIFPCIMGRKLCNEGIPQLLKCGLSCPQSVPIV